MQNTALISQLMFISIIINKINLPFLSALTKDNFVCFGLLPTALRSASRYNLKFSALPLTLFGLYIVNLIHWYTILYWMSDINILLCLDLLK